MKTKLRKAKEEDLVEIARIYVNEFSKPPYNEIWDEGKANVKVRSYFDDYDLYSINFDEQLVGFIAVNPNFMCPGEVAFGEEFAIKEEFQGRNIGNVVLKELFQIYKERGFKKIIGIANKDSRTLSLYERLGFNVSEKGVLVEKDLR